jgi:hypothetical protein
MTLLVALSPKCHCLSPHTVSNRSFAIRVCCESVETRSNHARTLKPCRRLSVLQLCMTPMSNDLQAYDPPPRRDYITSIMDKLELSKRDMFVAAGAVAFIQSCGPSHAEGTLKCTHMTSACPEPHTQSFHTCSFFWGPGMAIKFLELGSHFKKSVTTDPCTS